MVMTSAKRPPTEALKCHLAMEISRIPDHRAIPCKTHLYNSRHGRPRSPFIDWYLVLRVEEDVGTECIKKQYHKLALLLHPDKNHHPKAEIAFKLVSEAYACLTDEAKRRAFNLERWKRKDACCNCENIPRKSTTDLSYRHTNGRFNDPHSSRQSQSTPRTLKEIRHQMEEEARVIENCIRVNRKTRDEYPVFSPSSYLNQGYPHQQSREYKLGVDSVGCFGRGSVPDFHRRVKCETPVFELRTDCIPLNVRS